MLVLHVDALPYVIAAAPILVAVLILVALVMDKKLYPQSTDTVRLANFLLLLLSRVFCHQLQAECAEDLRQCSSDCTGLAMVLVYSGGECIHRVRFNVVFPLRYCYTCLSRWQLLAGQL